MFSKSTPSDTLEGKLSVTTQLGSSMFEPVDRPDREEFWGKAFWFIALCHVRFEDDSDIADKAVRDLFVNSEHGPIDKAAFLKSLTSPETFAQIKAYAEANFGEKCARRIDNLQIGTSATAPMEMPWVREARSGPHAHAKALYSVRLLLDAHPADVGNAVTASLLEGKSKRLDQVALAELYTAPSLAPEWDEVKGSAVMPEAARRDFFLKCNVFSHGWGLRLFHLDDCIQPIEGMPEGWKGFSIAYRHQAFDIYSLIDINKLSLAATSFFVREEPSTSSTQSVEGLAEGLDLPPDRVFTIYYRPGPFIIWKMLEAREGGWISKDIPCEMDGYFVYRCTVKAQLGSRGLRTELVREILDVTPWLRAQVLEEDEHLQKVQLFGAEDEGRRWSKAWGFSVVEVWRGIRTLEAKYIAMSHVCASLYCLCPGEGADAPCEHATPPNYDCKIARKLTRQLPHLYLQDKDTDQSMQFTEGSINIKSFASTLDRICSRAPLSADIFRRFVDLGSGCGSAVIAAHVLFPFRSCLGIEIVPELVEVSQERAHSILFQSKEFKTMHRKLPADDLFVAGDILHVDWSDASVVLCNAVTWPSEMMEPIFRLALQMRSGAVFILMGLNKRMPNLPEFLEAFDFRTDACLVSWQEFPCAFWLYQRI